MADERPETDALLARAAAGDGAAWGLMLTAHQERLRRMVAFRMDPRLQGRVDAADIVQDAFVEASAHRADYLNAPGGPLFIWLWSRCNREIWTVWEKSSESTSS